MGGWVRGNGAGFSILAKTICAIPSYRLRLALFNSQRAGWIAPVRTMHHPCPMRCWAVAPQDRSASSPREVSLFANMPYSLEKPRSGKMTLALGWPAKLLKGKRMRPR